MTNALWALLCVFSAMGASAQATTFAVIGDYGTASQAEQDVANMVKGWGPEFIITNGDNNYYSGAASTIDANIGQFYHGYIYPYKGTFGSGATTNRFWPTLGNHDWGTPNAKPYVDYFTLPGNERYYDFVRGPVHFFALDSDTHEPDGTSSTSTQGLWLKNRLAASTAPWKVVYFHHPPYSSGSHGSTTYMQWPFQAWGASIVLSGHDHDYERIVRSGFPYIVNGLGGASLYGFGSTPVSGSVVRYSSDYGAQRVIATTTDITFEFFNRKGVLVDTYTLSKATSLPAAPTGLVATAASSSQINLAWVDNATDESGYYIERSVNGGTFTQIATVGANVTSFSNTGLTASTTYSYRARAYNAAGVSVYSNTAVTATPAIGATAPAAPTGLTASAASGSQINLAWRDNASNESGYRIERSLSSATGFAEIAVVGANVTTFSSTGLTSSTTYYYRVRGYNAAGLSAYSNTASAMTFAGSGSSESLAAPSNLAVSVGPYDWWKLTLTWADNSTNETGFKIERSSDGISFTQIATVGSNVTTYASTGLTGATTYYYRVRAYNGTGDSAYSNVAVGTTKPQRPAAPTGLTATATSSSQINLGWTDNSTNEDGFKVFRSLDGTSFTQIGVVGPNVTSYPSTGLSAGTTYYYKVSAYNSGGYQYSNIASAATFR